MKRRGLPPVPASTCDDSDTQNDADEEDLQDAEEKQFSLPFFFSSLFATITEDCITQMRILVGCNTELNMMKTHVDLEHLRALKFDVEQPAYKDELEGITKDNIGSNDFKVNKLDADRTYLSNVFLASYLDMTTRRTFKSLASEAETMSYKLNKYPILLEDETKNRMTRRELLKQLRQLRNHVKSVYYDTDRIIENLKTNIEDSAVNTEVRSRYVTGWQRARTEQNYELIRLKESTPSAEIEYYKQRCDHEHRVHTEIELLVTISINETLAKVESWMDKYDKDMEALDLKIQIMKTKHTNAVEKRENFEKTIEKHAALIKSWVDFKNAREEARLYREKMNNAAITVQAWWRGMLVRNQLGPYKPMPKKRGGPPEKEKGKKKK